MIRSMLILMTICLALVGCEAGPIDVGGRVAPLEGTRWRLVKLFGEPVAEISKTSFIQLDPKTHRMSGSGPVNQISSSYRLEGGRLTFGIITSTKMAGSDEANQLEKDFLDGLKRVQTYRLVGTSLELQNSGMVVAQFVSDEDRQNESSIQQ